MGALSKHGDFTTFEYQTSQVKLYELTSFRSEAAMNSIDEKVDRRTFLSRNRILC